MSALSASQQVLDSTEYAAVMNSLSGKTRLLGDALDAFCEPVEDKYMNTQNPSDTESLLWHAWQSIVVIAACTVYTSPKRQKLADFILNLEHRPTLQKNDQICIVEGMTVWKDLPIFGWEMREAWNFAASTNSDQQHQDQWVNLNAWTSTLVASAHAKTSDKPGFSLYCIWTVRTALESQEQPVDVALEAAAVWFIYAASAIWDFCRQDKSYDGKVGASGSLFKDHIWTGFTMDRWHAWVQRLIDVQGAILTARARQLVQQARQAMGNITDE